MVWWATRSPVAQTPCTDCRQGSGYSPELLHCFKTEAVLVRKTLRNFVVSVSVRNQSSAREDTRVCVGSMPGAPFGHNSNWVLCLLVAELLLLLAPIFRLLP